MRNLSRSLLLATLATGSAVAQCLSVTTQTTAGNGQNGVMFDIVNTSAGAITIGSFDQCFFSGTTSNMSIYTKTGTWSGFENNAAAWTLLNATPAVTPHGVAPVLDAIPIVVNVTIAPGATQSFYLTGDTATTVAYTSGVNQINTVIGSNPDLQVLCGPGKAYPFGASFGLPTAGRIFNGRVNYCPSGSGTVLATNTVVGAGCGTTYNSFYQLFADAAVASAALNGNVLFLSPTPTGYSGAWAAGAAAALYVTPVAPTALATGDDGVVAVTPSSPLSTPFGPQSTLQVSGNGIIGFGAGTMDYPGTTSYTPTVLGFLNSALGGFYAWHDYNSGEVGSGPVQSEEIAGTLYITYNGVENYASPEVLNPSTIQFQLELATGNVRIVWLNVDSNLTSTFGSGHLVGVTGPGASADPGAVTLSTSILSTTTEQGPLTLAASNRPVQLAGPNAWNLTSTNLPFGFGIDILGVSDPGIPDLSFLGLGLPGCQLRASLDLLQGPYVTGGPHNWSFTIPGGAPALVNVHLFVQTAVLDITANLALTKTSNGIDGKIGDF